MPQSEDQNRAGFMQAINRCAEAYHHVKAQLPQNANFVAVHNNDGEACDAYIANLPILFDPASFQAYIACIAQGVAIGAIDLLDVGRFCHLAQTAMSAWKLANLIAPARKNGQEPHPLPTKGNHLESLGAPGPGSPATGLSRWGGGPSHSGTREGCRTALQPSTGPQNPDPLPTTGNQLEAEESPTAAAQPYDSDTQPKPHQSLNQPYTPGSGIKKLRREAWIAVQALKQAGIRLDKRPPASSQPGPETASEDRRAL